MASHILSADTLISSMMPSGGGTLASGDTIELSGHNLIIDADAVSYPVTLTNSGATAHLELRDGGRIKLNATLPTSICPWVDPENPLPAFDESKAIDGDPYRTTLTANARAEIQIGNFSLGGGGCSFPTDIRSGSLNFKAVRWVSNTACIVDRDVNLHPGDLVANTGTWSNGLIAVVSFDPVARQLVLANAYVSNIGNMASFCGGVLVYRVAVSNVPMLSTSAQFGTLVVIGNQTGAGQPCFAEGCSAIGNRLSWRSLMDGIALSPMCLNNCTFCVDECFAWSMTGRDSTAKKIAGKFGSLGGWTIADVEGPNCWIDLDIGELLAYNNRTKIVEARFTVRSGDGVNFSAGPRGYSRNIGTTIGGNVVEDTQLEAAGTVSRVARSDFPTDTDISDAFYFAPATAADTPWRYEDYWVRKGETLRIACRAMRGGDNGVARVAIGEMAVWVPADGMPTLAEWRLDSGEPLVWHGGKVEWTNDTDEDRQVRVWSMASGINGAYIRVWRATGGAL